MSDSATTSGAADLLCWPVRADLPISQTPWPTPSYRLRTRTRWCTTTIGAAGAREEVAPIATYTYEQIADDLDELRDHLGYERVAYSPTPWAASLDSTTAYATPRRAPASAYWSTTTPTGNPGKIAVPALRALGPTRTAKALALAAWYLAAWSSRSESKDKHAGRYAAMAVTRREIPAVRDKVKAAMAGLPVPNDNVPQLERTFARTDLPADSMKPLPRLRSLWPSDAIMVGGRPDRNSCKGWSTQGESVFQTSVTSPLSRTPTRLSHPYVNSLPRWSTDWYSNRAVTHQSRVGPSSPDTSPSGRHQMRMPTPPIPTTDHAVVR